MRTADKIDRAAQVGAVWFTHGQPAWHGVGRVLAGLEVVMPGLGQTLLCVMQETGGVYRPGTHSRRHSINWSSASFRSSRRSTRSVTNKTEHNAVGRFPEPEDEELLADPSRNFQVFEPLDFLAEVTQHIPDREHLIRYYGW